MRCADDDLLSLELALLQEELQAAASALRSLSAALLHMDATILSKYQEGAKRGWVLKVSYAMCSWRCMWRCVA